MGRLECLAESGQTVIRTATAEQEAGKYRQIFRLREVHLLAFFVLTYVGVEVTLGGARRTLRSARLDADVLAQGGSSRTSSRTGEVWKRLDTFPRASLEVKFYQRLSGDTDS